MTDNPYKAALDDFIAVRDATAARLKAAGDKEGAAEAKRARKPSLAAWAANQVVWQAPEVWEHLKAATAALREAHETAVAAESLRRAFREQREALLACEARAAELLTQNHRTADPDVLQKVGHTLLALAHGATGATPGRLERELAPPGFDAIAGLTLSVPEPPPPPPPDRARSDTSALPTPPSWGTADAEGATRRADRVEAETHAAEARLAVLKARAQLAAAEERRRRLETELEDARRASEAAHAAVRSAETESQAVETALAALGTPRSGD